MTLSKILLRSAAIVALTQSPALFAANNFTQHNLVADTAGAADNTDPNLVGTWGISASPTSPFWVSNPTNGTATLYNGIGVPNATVVHVPASAINQGKTGSPSGQVWNGYGVGNFEIAAGKSATFIFATLDGTISGFSGSAVPNVALMVDNGAKGAAYTGIGIGVSAIGPTLYAANFAGGTIDTFDKNFQPVTLAGAFLDPTLPTGFSPTNIQRFGRRLYVTYNPVGSGGYFTYGAGSGLINVFDLDGNLVQHLLPASGHLNIPWGLAVAGANFGNFSYTLLVGNFGDGAINAFDLYTGDYLGTMQDGNGHNLLIDGLWGLEFGSQGAGGNANGGDATALFFAAAPAGGAHGLFGSIRPASDSLIP